MKTRIQTLQAGFTLLELMAVIGVVAILAAVALPNFSTMLKNNCLTTEANSIVSSLNVARSEAIKRQTRVTITAASGDTADEWGMGWDITLDEDQNGNGVMDTGEDYNGNGALDPAALVRTVQLTCDLTTINETADRTTFVYAANGIINSRGTLNVCDDRSGENGSQITISPTGRIHNDTDFICP